MTPGYLRQVRRLIAEHGWAIQGVYPTGPCAHPDHHEHHHPHEAPTRPTIDRTHIHVPAALSPKPPPIVGYCYTVGLTARGLPELVLAGFPPELAHQTLNRAASRHVRQPYAVGDLVDGALNVPLKVGAEVDGATMLGALRLITDMFTEATSRRALHLWWPDPQGRYPDDAGWVNPYAQRLPTIFDRNPGVYN